MEGILNDKHEPSLFSGSSHVGKTFFSYKNTFHFDNDFVERYLKLIDNQTSFSKKLISDNFFVTNHRIGLNDTKDSIHLEENNLSFMI